MDSPQGEIMAENNNNKTIKIRILNPAMGVPITYLDKHNPDQFEIIGMSATAETMDRPVQLGETFVNRYRSQGGKGHVSANMYGVCFYDGNGNAHVPYGRILIRQRLQ